MQNVFLSNIQMNSRNISQIKTKNIILVYYENDGVRAISFI